MVDHEKIRVQAKQIMDEFVNALGRIGEVKEEYGVERQEETRITRTQSFPGFRERMFRNAPKKNKDYLIMERKHW